MNKKSGILSLLAVGILFGLSGSLAKYLSQWLNAYQVVFLRFGIAFILSIIVLILLKKKFDISKISKPKLILFAITFPISVIFFTLSVINTTVSLAVFSLYIANLLASFLFGAVIFKEKFNSKKLVALILILFALICFTNPFQNFTINIGFIFGLIAGVLQAVASIFQKSVSEKTERISLLIIQTFTGLAMAVIAMFVTNTLALPTLSLQAIGIALLFGAMFLVISYLSLIGFQRTNLSLGSLLVSTELFFGPLFALIIFTEVPASLEIIGGILTAVAVILANIDDK